MKIIVVKSSDLGLNCWLPIRFSGDCQKCERFYNCRYPEKRVTPENQAKMDERQRLIDEVKAVQAKIKALGQELGVPQWWKGL